MCKKLKERETRAFLNRFPKLIKSFSQIHKAHFALKSMGLAIHCKIQFKLNLSLLMKCRALHCDVKGWQYKSWAEFKHSEFNCWSFCSEF